MGNIYIESSKEDQKNLSCPYNGTVCIVERDGRSGRTKMIPLTEKLLNLKYELLVAYLDRDIQFLSSALIEY